MDDEVLKDDESLGEPREIDTDLDAEGVKKPKDLIDEDTVSLEDEAEEELEEEEEPFDDVTNY